MTHVVARMAAADDAASLAGLRLAPLGEGGVQPGVADPAKFVASFATWMATHRSTHLPFVAVSGTDVVGAAWLVLAERVPSPERRNRRWCGDVQSVYVVPELRGRGIGTTLLGAVLAEAARRRLEHVTVHSNDAATPLYQKVGFAHDPDWLSWNP